jgi:hypothetical protein
MTALDRPGAVEADRLDAVAVDTIGRRKPATILALVVPCSLPTPDRDCGGN